jgi:2-dehydro-3-deoxyphosphogluconate aldolase/(4S)-4-hydroxy-2-oxoglutarate aldolase
MMHTILEEIEKIGIIPVIKIDAAAKAVPLAEALTRGGIPCAEITFRTAQGEAAIRAVKKAMPDMIVGAGTVLSPEQVDAALDAGAQFIVSPGFNPRVVARCVEKNIPVTPGCSSPSDIERALEAGLEVVKFFPAEQAGGLDYIKAVAAPYPTVKFIPTGGINPQNLADYIGFDKVLACGGSWMAAADLIGREEYPRITALCREAVLSLLGFNMVHLGINTAGEADARRAAAVFEAMFGFLPREGNNSVFAGKGIEIMKSPYLGKNGHIAVATNSLIRAKAYLSRAGFAFREDTLKYNAAGAPATIYLEEEIMGFALHLIQIS